MDKIPVGETISNAYSFAFQKFFTIAGLIWLPFVVIAAGGIAMSILSADFPAAIVFYNPTAMEHVRFLLFPFYVFTLVASFVIIVAIMQYALGLRAPYYFSFPLGKPVWRLLGAFILVFLLIVALVLIAVIGTLLVGMAVAAVSGAAPGTKPTGAAAGMLGLGTLIFFAVLYCGFIYVLVRQTFFLTPVVVAEDRIDLGRAWKLGRGNFWRMLLVLLAIFIPIVIVELVFAFAFFLRDFPPLATHGATPDQIAAWSAHKVARIKQYWFLLVPIYFVFLTLIYGLLSGAQAFAYRYLVTAKNTEELV